MTTELETRVQINQQIWNNLVVIQDKVSLSDEQMAELLGSRLGDFRLSCAKKRSPPLLALIRLSRRLNLELSHIYFELPEDFNSTRH